MAVGLALALSGCGEPGSDSGGSGSDTAAHAEAPAAASGQAPGERGAGQGLAIVDPHHDAHPGWRDLGTIPLGEVATHTVELVNREGRPLTIRSVRAGCACTIPTIGYRDAEGQLVQGDARASGNVLTVPAGALVELTLTIDSRRAPVKNKSKRVNVRLVTDSNSDPYLTIEAQFLVETPFQVAPEALQFGEVALHGTGDAALRILRLRDRSPTGVVGVPEGFEVQLAEAYYLGTTSWDLTARVLPPVEAGYSEHLIELTTVYDDGTPAPNFQLPIRITGVPDLELRPTRLVLQPDPEGAVSAEVVLASNLGGHRIALSAPRFDGPLADLLEVELEPSLPDDDLRSPSWTIRVRATGPLPEGSLAGNLVLDSDDPEHPVIEIPYLRLERS